MKECRIHTFSMHTCTSGAPLASFSVPYTPNTYMDHRTASGHLPSAAAVQVAPASAPGRRPGPALVPGEQPFRRTFRFEGCLSDLFGGSYFVRSKSTFCPSWGPMFSFVHKWKSLQKATMSLLLVKVPTSL